MRIDTAAFRIYKNRVDVEFDPDKDAANIAKHGVSLSRTADLEILGFVDDSNRFDEPRYRLYGLIDLTLHCAAVTDRNGRVRAISLRRAHRKEFNRYVGRGGHDR